MDWRTRFKCSHFARAFPRFRAVGEGNRSDEEADPECGCGIRPRHRAGPRPTRVVGVTVCADLVLGLLVTTGLSLKHRTCGCLYWASCLFPLGLILLAAFPVGFVWFVL